MSSRCLPTLPNMNTKSFLIRGVVIAALAIVSISAPVVAEKPATKEKSFKIPETDEGLPGAGPIRRYEWFQKLWERKRSGWAGRGDADKGAVFFFGDSITQGWGDDMKGSFPGVKVANRGISGDTTRGMLIRLKEDVLDQGPSGVVLLAGTNDLEEGAEPKVIADNMKLILDALQKYDHSMPIYLCMVFPSSDKKKRPSDKIKEINALYREVAKGEPQISIIETWKLFANEEGDAKAEEFPDLLHPNDKGYAKWASALRPFLALYGYLDSEKDEFELEEGFESLLNGKDLTGWGYIENKKRGWKREVFDVI